MNRYLRYAGKAVVFALMVIVGMIGVQIVYGVVAEPGSQQDPIITQSYIEEVVVPQIYEYINEKVNTLSNKASQLEEMISAQQGQGGTAFTVVSVKAGQKLIGGAGTELILRMGRATIIATEKGGLADTTQGKDLQTGEQMPPNHLLIVPLEDGRGFQANNDVLVMVKGSYVIQ